MKLSDFDYDLPEMLIAQRPLPRRDASRMMVVDRAADTIAHESFARFPDRLASGDVLVINDSKVRPARVWGKRGESRIEFLFLEERETGVWEVMCRPARKVGTGDAILFAGGVSAVVVEKGEEGRRLLRLEAGDAAGLFESSGYAPLPPYIKRGPEHGHLRESDLDRYQTVFAREEGSIAAPTAGLHFTREVLDAVRGRGVVIAPVSLDVGLATFQPVRVDEIERHRMLEEAYSVTETSAAAVNLAKAEGRPVTAVGTTSVRTLESAAREGRIPSGRFTTDLFIRPGYRFRIVDRLLTNFHLPKSTLLMLTAAFGGRDLIMRAYDEAVRAEYRFFSYGDCMLIM